MTREENQVNRSLAEEECLFARLEGAWFASLNASDKMHHVLDFAPPTNPNFELASDAEHARFPTPTNHDSPRPSVGMVALLFHVSTRESVNLWTCVSSFEETPRG